MNSKARVVCKTVLNLYRGQSVCVVVVGGRDNLPNLIGGPNKHWGCGKKLEIITLGRTSIRGFGVRYVHSLTHIHSLYIYLHKLIIVCAFIDTSS